MAQSSNLETLSKRDPSPPGSRVRFSSLKLHIASVSPYLCQNLGPKKLPKHLPAASVVYVRTPADAVGATHIVAVVAIQSFMVVARLSLVAVLVELRCAHLAAAATVGDQTDPRGAQRGHRGALAHYRTVSSHLQEGETCFISRIVMDQRDPKRKRLDSCYSDHRNS